MCVCVLERFDHLTVCKQMTCLIELFVIDSNTWNHVTMCKRMILGAFNKVIDKMFL